MAKLPVEQIAALVSLASRFTTSARSHAALGLANAALCAEQVRSAACLRSLPPSPPRPPRAAASAATTWPLHRLPLLHPPLLLPPPRPQREVLRTSGLLEPALKHLLEAGVEPLCARLLNSLLAHFVLPLLVSPLAGSAPSAGRTPSPRTPAGSSDSGSPGTPARLPSATPDLTVVSKVFRVPPSAL